MPLRRRVPNWVVVLVSDMTPAELDALEHRATELLRDAEVGDHTARMNMIEDQRNVIRSLRTELADVGTDDKAGS